MLKENNIFSGAERLDEVNFSPVRKVLERAKEIEKDGKKVIHFEVGEPDFDTPKEIIDATIQALKNNLTHYAPNRGLLSLRKAICDRVKERKNIEYDPLTEIIVTVGGAEAINNTIFSIVNQGDEVIVFTPAFMNYLNVIKMTGGVPVIIPLKIENNFAINIDELENKITPKTKLIIINNPSNPTGIIYTREDIEKVSKMARKYDLLVLSDEIYDEIVYDNTKITSISALEGMKERTIVINGFSKAFSMTGWRLGYILADSRLMQNILKVHQYTTTCVPTFIQDGVAKTMNNEECNNKIKDMVMSFEHRRNLLLQGIDQIKELKYVKPQGAFYIFVNVHDTGLNGKQFAEGLLETKYVAVVPGTGFDEESIDFIRMSFATSDEDIKTGIERITEYVEENKKK